MMLEACKNVLFKEITPAVIDNDMIIKALNSRAPEGEAGRLAKEDGLIFEEVTELYLDFSNILRLDYLWIFTSLTKLSLSNNMIEKIENLDTLIHLTELDLSFNVIERIENLEKLVNLEILTLYSNKIKTIENMHTFTKLHIFSIGRNAIEDRDNIFHLRKLSTLRSLNMAGNSCASTENFKFFLSAFLPQLVYYEYKRITIEEKTHGLELFKKIAQKIDEQEAIEFEIARQLESEKAEAERNAESFVEFLGERQLFDSLFEKDPEGKILLEITDIATYFKEYEENFLGITRILFEVGQERYVTRKEEVDQFMKCVYDAKLDNQKRSQQAMEKFIERKENLKKEVKTYQDEMKMNNENKDDQDVDMEIDMNKYLDQMQVFSDTFQDITHHVWKELMGMEMTLFGQLEETNLNFERALTELVNNFIEEAQGYFTQLRSFEQMYMEFCFEEGNKMLGLYQATENIDISEELQALCEDKELMVNAVASSHDVHMQLIDAREDRLMNRAKQYLQQLVNNLQKDEIARNREKVLEINHFLDCQKEEFEEFFDNPNLLHDVMSEDML